jgi:hypothetical protein
MTPRQLYKWAVVKIPSVTFEYCTVKDHSKETMMLEDRFKKARTLTGTQETHCVKKPSSDKSVFRSKCVQHHTYSTHAK